MTKNKLLSHQWSSGLVPQVDGIFFKEGAVVLILARTIRIDAEVSLMAEPLAETNLQSLLLYNQDLWVEVTPLCRLEWTDEMEIVAGEGAMGNEGFVALIDKHGEPIWVLFCCASNPFVSLERDGEIIMAEAGYGHTWHIPVNTPDKFTLRIS